MQESDVRQMIDRLARLETTVGHLTSSVTSLTTSQTAATSSLAVLTTNILELQRTTRNHVIKAACYKGAQSTIQYAGFGGSILTAVYFFGRLLGWWSG